VKPTPLSISWTALQRYEACHQRHLRTLEGKAIRKPFASRDFLAGNIADRVQRAWLHLPDPQPGQMAQMVPDMFDRWTNPDREDEEFQPVKWRGDPQVDRKEVQEFCTLVVTRLEPILLKWVVPYDYQPELRFEAWIGLPDLNGDTTPVRLIGAIDIVVRLPDGRFLLFDLKATKNDSYIAKTLGQGIFYDVSWAHYWGQHPIRFGFIAPALDERLIWCDIDTGDRAVMHSRIMRFAQGMWAGEWAPKADDEGCDHCDCKHACDKYALHLTVDDQGRHRASFEEALEARRTGRT
jgi:hypothetical protein